MIKPAVSLAKMLAAHIGMVADGKAYYFRQNFLKEMEKKIANIREELSLIEKKIEVIDSKLQED